MYRFMSNMYRYMFSSGRVYRYMFKVYRYMSPENAQNVYFLPLFHIFDTQINSILHIHIKTISNSSYNLFSTQIIIQFISFIKTFHDFLLKITLIWVITHTPTKYKDLLGFVLTQLFTLQLIHESNLKGRIPCFLVHFGFYPPCSQ